MLARSHAQRATAIGNSRRAPNVRYWAKADIRRPLERNVRSWWGADVDYTCGSSDLLRVKLWLVLSICIGNAAGAQVLADPTPANLTWRLAAASQEASASHDCPSRRQKRYAADFVRRYGERIRQLKAIHVAQSGPDPDFVVVSNCRISSLSGAAQNARHREAMEAFAPRLRALEEDFGHDQPIQRR